MALHWPTFFTRLGSAIVFSIIMMAGLLWNDYAFLGLTLLIEVLCLRDYFRLVKKITPDVHWPSWLPLVIQIVGALLVALAFGALHHPSYLTYAITVAVVFPIVTLLGATLSKRTGWEASAQAFGGVLYTTLPAILFLSLRDISIIIPLALVLMIWMNDTMAYLVGSFIGKTPFSKISPKKTWEGTAGGALLTIVGAGIWGYYSPYYHMADWMALAACAAVAGTAGDLLESKLKRMADVKDSGTMMPGHGGALDRFDSLLVAIPFAFAYAFLFMEQVILKIF